MRLNLLVTGTVAAAALTLTLGTALPASAATDATFTLTGGDLEIIDPATVDFGATDTGGADTGGAIGLVTVTDERSALDANWTASVISTAFTTGGASANETVPAADVSYWSGAITEVSGDDNDYTPGQATVGDAEAIDTITPAATAVASGDNVASWTPTLIINVDALDVAGDYEGTVTHSVL